MKAESCGAAMHLQLQQALDMFASLLFCAQLIKVIEESFANLYVNCSLLKTRYDLGIAFSLQDKPCNFESWWVAAFVLKVSETMGLGAYNKLPNDYTLERKIMFKCLIPYIFHSTEAALMQPHW